MRFWPRTTRKRSVERASVGDLEARHQPLENLLARRGRAGQLAESIVVPVLPVSALRAAVLPGGVVAHRRDADEQVDVAHDLGEDQGRHLFERQRLVDAVRSRSGGTAAVAAAAGVGRVLRRLQPIEAHLVRRQPQEDARIVRVRAIILADALDPELGAQAPLRQLLESPADRSASTISRSLFFQPRAAHSALNWCCRMMCAAKRFE